MNSENLQRRLTRLRKELHDTRKLLIDDGRFCSVHQLIGSAENYLAAAYCELHKQRDNIRDTK